jgi:hypothetical protein
MRKILAGVVLAGEWALDAFFEGKMFTLQFQSPLNDWYFLVIPIQINWFTNRLILSTVMQ